MTDLEAKAREIAKRADFILEGEPDEPLIVDTDILAHAILTALRSIQSETIERAAKVADDLAETVGPVAVCGTIAARIRSLKESEKPQGVG